MHLAELWRYPVKGLGGESLDRATLSAGGMDGDRLVRIEGSDGTVTARSKPKLVGLRGAIGSDGVPTVDGRPWTEPEAVDAIRSIAGEGARLVPAGEDRFDLAPILVATDGALAEFGRDRRRYRPNLVVGSVEGMVEREWIGSRISVGRAVLSAREPCERCIVTTIDPDTLELDPSVLTRLRERYDGIMGVYCEVLEPGPVAVGDPVELE